MNFLKENELNYSNNNENISIKKYIEILQNIALFFSSHSNLSFYSKIDIISIKENFKDYYIIEENYL